MKKIMTVLTSVLLLSATSMVPADEGKDHAGNVQTPIYGSQLMTPQERKEHRMRIRNARSAEEREQIRREHHEKMKQRAKAHGIELPDQPPTRRQMIKPGAGMGSGMGRSTK